MSDRQDSGFGFRIRPLPPKGAAQEIPEPPPRPASPAKPPAPSPKAQADLPPAPVTDHTAGLFNSAQAALAFLGAVAGAGLAAEARARRGANGRWWIETPAPWLHAATLVVNAGGRAYVGGLLHWVAAPADGSVPPPPTASRPGSSGFDILLQSAAGNERLPLTEWPEAGLADLLLATQLRPAKPRLLDQVVVVAPGVLARTILRRAVALGFDVQVAAAQREPLAGGAPTGVSWLRIRWGQARTPDAYLHSIMRLPFVAVARPVGIAQADDAARAALLVDIRHAAPLSSALVAALVPTGEHWLLGGAEVGHWRVRVLGAPSDAAEMIALPSTPDAALSTPALETGDHRAPIKLRLVQRAPLPGHPDAVLLDDAELGWLRDYLIGKPAAETAYLLLGPGRHLLLAPGGVLSTLPFGLTLRRIGPGGLHLQEGRALFPPLPEAARGHTFPCGEGEIVTLTCGETAGGLETTRFRLDELTPVWALWLGEPQPVATGVTGELAQRMRNIAAMLQPEEKPRRLKQAASIIPTLRERPKSDRDQLLRDALRLEQQGRLAEAAQNMERAGELAAAGRLYERAAGGR